MPRGVVDFNPDLHPRDAHGEFAKVLQGLKVGHEAHLPDGTRVQAVKSGAGSGRTQRKFKVHAPSEDLHAALNNLVAGHSIASSTHKDAESAAINALDRSAHSATPSSVGGRKRYTSFEDYRRRQQVRAA